MVAVIPVMIWSICLVRYRRNYQLHKRVQLTLGGVLLVAVLLFEIDMRVHGWRQFAEPSPYYDNWLWPILYVHLFFAVSTSVLWVYTIAAALRRFPRPPAPNSHSRRHRIAARAAAGFMCMTAVTGWLFYWAAFVA
jgi:uncharacterized membrane protein YozB (DUF420 family)